MKQRRHIKVYARKRHGAYPEVDNFILVDLAAIKTERYLVDGEAFAPNLAKAREMMAEKLQLRNPKLLDVTEREFESRIGKPRKPTDEGNKIMARGPQTLAVAQGKLAQAQRDLEATKARSPASDSAEDKAALQVAIGKAEDRVKYQERAVKAAEAGMSVKQFEKSKAPVVKSAAAKGTNKEQIGKPGTSNEPMHFPGRPTPVPQPARTQQKPAPAPQPMPPMMIETGGIKITVNNADQMDMAIGSLKKHSVI